MHDSAMDDTDLPGLTDHEAQNRASWNADSDDYQARHGEQLAASTGLAWGVMQIPEAELRVLGDVAGKDILELGCGAAQWSIALARLGARPVGIDLSERQLEHARRLMAEAGLDFPLIHGSAEHVPLPDASFDIVFCDHGAMTFADPYRTVPEAARLLRSGGLFAFSHHTPIESIAWPLDSDKVGRSAGGRLLRDASTRRRRDLDVPAALRRVDPAVPGERAGRGGPDRAAPRGRRHELVPDRRGARVGPPLAGRGDLAGPEGLKRGDRAATWNTHRSGSTAEAGVPRGAQRD